MGKGLGKKLLKHEEAWNVLTDDYETWNIKRGNVVIASKLIPEYWDMRQPKLVILLIEGMGDRGVTGAPFIRQAVTDKAGRLCFLPGGGTPEYQTMLYGFVTEIIEVKKA